MVRWEQATEVVRRWARLATLHPRPQIGDRVRIVAGPSGVVVSSTPLVVRDGRGAEHEVSIFRARLEHGGRLAC